MENCYGNDGIKKESQQLVEERSDKENVNGISDEELHCNSRPLDSEGERAIAAFDERIRMRKAEFAEENQIAIDRIENIKEQFGAQQEKDHTSDQEIDDIKTKYDKLQEDMRRLDEVTRRREREEMKWRKKMDKKMKINAIKLEKIRAERRLYQVEIEAENASQPEVRNNNTAQDLETSTAQQYGGVPQETKSTSKESLHGPAEVTEYDSVEQLEKKRKELKRLEKLEKEAVKREKLERKERKKIAKEKRKVERKLEKMRKKECAVAEDLEASKFGSVEPAGTCSSIAQDGSNQLLHGDENEQLNDHGTRTSDAEEKNNDASNKVSEDDAASEESWQSNVPNNQISQACDNEEDEFITARASLPEVLEDEILTEDLPDYLDREAETESEHQRPMESENNFLERNDGSPYTILRSDENNSTEFAAVNNKSDVQQNLSLGSPAEMGEKDTINDAGKKEITEDLTSMEEEIDIETKSDFEANDENSAVFSKQAPLVRKQSGRFTLHGVTPLFHSPENPIDNEIQEDMGSLVEDLEECELLFEKRLALHDNEEAREHLSSSSDCVLEDLDEVPIADYSQNGYEAAYKHLAASSDCVLEDLHEVPIADYNEHGYEEEVQVKSRSELSDMNISAVTERTQTTLPQSDSQSPYVILPEPETEDETEDDFSDRLFLTFCHEDGDSIQTKQMSLSGYGARSQVRENVDDEASVERHDELSICEDDMSELYPKEVDSAEERDSSQTEDIKVSTVQGMYYI